MDVLGPVDPHQICAQPISERYVRARTEFCAVSIRSVFLRSILLAVERPRKPSEIFDRDDEWNDLACFAVDGAPGATLGVVSGRRRQGKTITSPWRAAPCRLSSSTR